MAVTEVDDTAINYPAWTDYKKKNGLDPLGMQNSSVSLYQTFLPGISNVTLRMRYYGLYAWLCRSYAQRVGDTNPESWKRFIRRAEALYALLSYHHGNETGVAGIEWAQKAYDEAASDDIDFAQAAEPGSETYYLKQAWGIYGLAYRSQLFDIGIFTSSADHEIPVPSAEIGDRLALAFGNALGAMAKRFLEAVDRGSVTKAELDQFSPLAPSEISLTSDERAIYQEVLLNPHDAADSGALSRRLSLTLVLKVATLLGRDPKPDEVRWIFYAGCDERGRALEPGSPALEAQRQRWWVYQANDLCHIALEALLKFTLDNLAGFPGGITLSRLIPTCVDRILDVAPQKPECWPDFLEMLHPALNPNDRSEPDAERRLVESIMRSAGRSDESVCPAEVAWDTLKLLGILHKRVREEAHDIKAELGGFDPDAFRSLLSETRFLERQMNADFREALGRLLEERVIRRHLWVALRKFRHQGDYTFLIETDEGRFRLREKDGPVFTNPRLGPAITFLKDIHLVGGQGLTEQGVEALGSA